MGLILRFRSYPTPLHVADDGLPTFVDVDVFDGDFLLTFAAMPVECFQQGGICSRELVCLAEVFAPRRQSHPWPLCGAYLER